LLADGSTKPIEDVDTGDLVLATDPETGETVARTTVATITTEYDKDFTVLTVATENGPERLVATDTHPFWVPEADAWIDAGDLLPGQWLRTSSGTHVQISAITRYTQQQRTHDLTVAELHTYYVLAGAAPLLVHNCGGLDDAEHASIQDTYGNDIADGVDYNLQRMCSSCNSGSDVADHGISGIGGNVAGLASYLTDQRDLGMTHVDRRKPGTTARRDESRLDRRGRGVSIVRNSYMIHAYHQSLDEFNSIFNAVK
jgi:hypothetical protein